MSDLPSHLRYGEPGPRPTITSEQAALIYGPGLYDSPPYLDTKCFTCGAPLKHNGSNQGVHWFIPDAAGNPSRVSAFGAYDCPNNVSPGYIGRHVPVEIVSQREIDDAVTSIQTSIQNGATA